MVRFYLLLSLFLVGCFSYHALPSDTSRAAHNRINCQEQKKLVIAAEDYSASEKSQRYFQRDLLELGYIPIYISISNISQDSEFTLKQENAVFQFEDGMEAYRVPVQQVMDDAYHSKTAAAIAMPFGIIPGVVLWLWTDHVNSQLDQDYSGKAFRDFHILPGERKFGFIFFQVPFGIGKITSKEIKDGSIEFLVFKKASSTEMAEVFNFFVSIEPK